MIYLSFDQAILEPGCGAKIYRINLNGTERWATTFDGAMEWIEANKWEHLGNDCTITTFHNPCAMGGSSNGKG